MGDEKIVVYRFPENVDTFIKQATSTLHDLDMLQPGTTLNAIQVYFDSMHEESKLRIELLKLQLKTATAQESLNTQLPNELKEVKQSVSALSSVLKGTDKRLKHLESQRIEKPEVPPKKWGSTQPQNVRSNRRDSQTPTVPQLPTLQQMQPQHANEKTGNAVNNEGAVTREGSSQEKVATPFNSSLSDQLSTKVKAVGT